MGIWQHGSHLNCPFSFNGAEVFQFCFSLSKLLFLFSAKLDMCCIMMFKSVWTNETWFKFDNLNFCILLWGCMACRLIKFCFCFSVFDWSLVLVKMVSWKFSALFSTSIKILKIIVMLKYVFTTDMQSNLDVPKIFWFFVEMVGLVSMTEF